MVTALLWINKTILHRNNKKYRNPVIIHNIASVLSRQVSGGYKRQGYQHMAHNRVSVELRPPGGAAVIHILLSPSGFYCYCSYRHLGILQHRTM